MSEKLDEDLLEENLVRFAIKQYYTPRGIDFDEFYTDLKRFQYVKRLLNRYCDYGKLGERLILNHLIVIFNVFGYYGGLKILGLKLDDRHWPIIKPFLVFLKTIRKNQYTDIKSDPEVEEKLRKI
jgi:hypothetical protein|tara:strand:+ start:111 stop:485 length:375 start_codon:yes stop_codon:yes gene_type:complete